MRRVAQAAVLVALAMPGVVLGAPGVALAAPAAGEQSAKPEVLQSAWFWQHAYQQVNPPIGEAPPDASEPSGVPEGDLAVAHTSNDGTSSKITVVSFNIAALDKTDTIASFEVTLTLDGPPAASFNASDAPIIACLPTRQWSPADGGDYTDAPPVNCLAKVEPKVKGDTYTFDITTLAQSWVADQNLGVAFVNDPDNTATPFQAVFTGAKTVQAKMTYHGGTTTTVTPTPTDAGTATAGGGSTGSTGSAPSGPGPAAPAPAPVDLPPPAADTAPDQTSQPPEVATQAPDAATPVAAARPSPSAPNAAFWAGAAALTLLLLTAAVVLADDRVPVPGATTSRLGRVLRERERERALQHTADPTPAFTPREA